MLQTTARADTRLQELKDQPRTSGEASFFWYENQFRCEAVRVLPGEYFVSQEQILIMTTLGSCIAACIWDRDARLGGMNHFMLPGGASDNGRYGAFAMEVLINAILKSGGRRRSLEAKVFGGGQVIAGMDSMNIGQRNAEFVLDYLRTERIPVVSKDVLDIYPRKVCLMPATGKAMVKRLAATQAAALIAAERAHAPAVQVATSGSIDLF